MQLIPSLHASVGPTGAGPLARLPSSIDVVKAIHRPSMCVEPETCSHWGKKSGTLFTVKKTAEISMFKRSRYLFNRRPDAAAETSKLRRPTR
jgi:hypothetical protein